MLGETVLGGQGWSRVGGLYGKDCGGSVVSDVPSNPHVYLLLSF